MHNNRQMAKENLVQKLGKKVMKKALPWFMAGALAVGSLFYYGCSENFTDTNPDNPDKPQKPIAMFIANPTEGDAPLFVEFDGSLSHSNIKKYYWDFDGDGNTDVISQQPQIGHTYNKGGEYNSSLRVVDSNNQTSTNKALEIIVVNEEPIITLEKIAFYSNPDWTSEGCPEDSECNEDIYSGDIIIRNDNIELVNIDRLTKDPGQDFEPTWSPDGTEILFTSNRDGFASIYRMDANGNNQENISSDLIWRATQADWGSSGKIAVSYGYGEGIGIIDLNENPYLFTPIYPNSGTWPKWSPDYSKIAFRTYVNGNWEIYIMNSDGTNPTNLTNNSATEGDPTFLPDGRILFWSDRENPGQIPLEADLYVMDQDGNNVERLTYESGRELDPEISSDGKYLLFERLRFLYDPSQIYITELINADDSTKWIQLTTKGANCYAKWKPKIEDLNFN